MYRWMLIVVLYVVPLLGHGQSHGLPSGISTLMARFACLDDSVDNITVYTGAFASYASKAFDGATKYEATLDFSDYVRAGTFVSIDRRLYRNLTVGFTIPYLYSTVYRATSWYPSDNYSISGITEIKLRIAYNLQTEHTKFFAGISTELPLQKGRQAFASPAMYIGNDAFWSVGADAGIIGALSDNLKAFGSFELNLRVPKNGSLVEGNQALILSSDSVQSIQAQIALRSWVSLNLGLLWNHKNFDYSLAYELYAENQDYIKQLIPAGYLEQTATLESMKGKPCWNHNMNIGIATTLHGIRFAVVGKAAVAGYGTFDEKIVLLVIGFKI